MKIEVLCFFLIFQGNQIFWTKGSSIAFNQKWTRPLGFHRIHCSPDMIFHLLQKRSPTMCLHIRIDFHTLALKKKNIKKKIYSDSYPNWILKNLLLIFGQIRANPVFARKCANICPPENLYEWGRSLYLCKSSPMFLSVGEISISPRNFY